jgi:hypothetical protein
MAVTEKCDRDHILDLQVTNKVYLEVAENLGALAEKEHLPAF